MILVNDEIFAKIYISISPMTTLFSVVVKAENVICCVYLFLYRKRNFAMNATNGTKLVSNVSSLCDSALLDSVTTKVFKTVALSILLLISLVGNSLVPAVVYRNPELHTSINHFIVSMSISDLLITLVAFPERIKIVYVPQAVWQIDGIFGLVLCKLRAFLVDTSLLVTVLSLLIVSFERLFAITYPFKKQYLRGKKSCFIVIAFTWIFAMLCSLRNFYIWRLSTVNDTTYCFPSWEPAFNGAQADTVEYIILLVCFAIIPSVLLISVYSAIVISLRRKKTPVQIGSYQRSQMEKENRRVTYMLLTVVLSFFVPANAQQISVLFYTYVWTSSQYCANRQLVFALLYITLIYYPLNPFIYCLYNPRYKRGVKKLLCCNSHCTSCKDTEQEIGVRFHSKDLYSLEPEKNITFISMISLHL